jgi:hypothetical protein
MIKATLASGSLPYIEQKSSDSKCDFPGTSTGDLEILLISLGWQHRNR